MHIGKLALGCALCAGVLLTSVLCRPAPKATKAQPVALVADNELLQFSDYRSWVKVNPEPLRLGSKLDALCRAKTREEEKINDNDPHRQKSFTVFVNGIGSDRMFGKSEGEFPVGASIVKEKHVGNDPQSSELLTAMVKREKEFAPEIGDWEFFVLEGMAKRIELRGAPKHCVSCHLDVKSSDYVFADYVPKSSTKNNNPD